MNPNEKAEQARELFLSGHNCAQSVYAAFAEDMGMSHEELMEKKGRYYQLYTGNPPA